ncbi:MAG: choice-of-anchor Q domain-containing protein, partial [Anaerolineae bacterium]
ASDEGPRDGLSGPVGSTTLIRAVVEGNQAEYAGGAISSRHRVTIRDSVIRGNRAGSFGGGLHLAAPLTMSRSLLAGNRAGMNGSAAIVNDAVMDNCLIAENLVDGPRPYPDAAAIDSRAWLRLIHCTVAGNGVLHGDQGSALHQSVSYYFGDERIQQTRLVASLIIGNHPANCWGGIIDGGGNLQFPGNSCGESLSTMPVSFVEERDPSGLLRALIPRDDSTAVDAAADGSCLSDPVLAVDARGRARPYSQRPGATAACDIGAFESGSAATSTPGYRPRATATSEPADLIVYPASYDEVCPGPDTGLPRLAVRNQGPSGASATDLEVLGLRYPVPALAPGQKVIINLAEWSGPFDAVDPENKVRELVEDNNSPHGNVPVLWSRPELTCTPIPTLPSQSPTRTPTRLPPPTSLPSFLPDAWFQDVIWSRECQTGKRQVQPCLSTRGPAAAAAYRVVSEPPGLSWDIDPAVAACGEPRLAPPDLTALRIDPQNLIQERSEINNRRGVPPPDFPPRSACTATPTATPSATPTMTPTPTDAPTRRPTATRSPTRTRTPSPTVGPGWTRRLSLPRLESAP